MKRRKLWSAIAALLLLLPCAALANYRFDDLYGPSGKGAQWMVVTGTMDTVGSPTRTPLDARGNIVDDRNSIVVHNGRTTLPLDLENRDIHTMFLVLPSTQGRLDVNFAVTPETPMPAVTPDVLVDSAIYNVRKNPVGSPFGFGKLYELDFFKTQKTGEYGSSRGNFIFHQNPRDPSQTLQVPFVIANVFDGTAVGNPLLFRATLRDPYMTGFGDITAYDRFTWNVVDPMTAGNGQWVFVPVPSWPAPARINYRLTTEVTNYTGIRYAVQRYDNYIWNHLIPSYWAFDLPRLPSMGDVPKQFQLDDLSHIAPGLVTVYNQPFNVVQGGKVPLRLYPVDPAAGFRELTLLHNVIYGIDLGTVTASSGAASISAPHSFKVTGFRLVAADEPRFLSALAAAMNARSVWMPLGQTLSPGTAASVGVSSEAVNAFAVDAPIPGSDSAYDSEGLLPLHVTFNLPRTHLLLATKWDRLAQQWREVGDIKNSFAQTFSVYLRSGAHNDLDLIQELIKLGAYDKAVKVFLDEQRGVITVSFIVMVMDGTRDGSRPALRLVKDKTSTTDNNYIVLRDGAFDNRWKMAFYTAPAGRVQFAPVVSGDPTPPIILAPESSGGGGGCDAGLGATALTALAAFVLLKGKRR